MILFRNRLCHLGVFAAPQGILTADDALQGRHFGDHLGCQIGFGEIDGARQVLDGRHILFSQTQHLTHLRAEFQHPVRFIEHGAKFGVEGQRGEFGAVFFQFEFHIFADEEVCIGKARAEDMFVSFADGVDADVIAVADGDEVR